MAPPAPPPGSAAEDRTRAVGVLRRSTGVLSTAATARMERDLTWFAELSAEDRSWVGLIVQAGIRGFVESYATGPQVRGAQVEDDDPLAVTSSVFGAAPRALTGVITLQQTVELVKLSIEVVESSVAGLVEPDDVAAVQIAASRYAREIAFATAEVYAHAAEVRGAWDARLEALVVDAVLRAETDEAVLSRASALGWKSRGTVCVVLGTVPGRRTETDLFEEVRRVSATAGMDALCAVQGDRLVVLLGGIQDPVVAARAVVGCFGPEPVVVGPVSADLAGAPVSARAAMSAYRAVTGWPEAPRPVPSDELLAERALAGDGHARRELVEAIYLPLLQTRGALVETLRVWQACGCNIEATARSLFVHPNTVRYRLRQVAELTGRTPGEPRDSFTLQIALVLGQLSGRDG